MTMFLLYLVFAFVQAVVVARHDGADRSNAVHLFFLLFLGAPIVTAILVWRGLSEAIIWLVTPGWVKKGK